MEILNEYSPNYWESNLINWKNIIIKKYNFGNDIIKINDKVIKLSFITPDNKTNYYIPVLYKDCIILEHNKITNTYNVQENYNNGSVLCIDIPIYYLKLIT